METLILIQMPALCGNGAKKLLENGKSLMKVMVDCMNSSDSHALQMEGFRLARCLMVRILIVISFSCILGANLYVELLICAYITDYVFIETLIIL